MKQILRMTACVLALCIALLCGAVVLGEEAEALELTFTPGEDLVIYDQDGIRITILGERGEDFAKMREDNVNAFNYYIVRVENNTDNSIETSFNGKPLFHGETEPHATSEEPMRVLSQDLYAQDPELKEAWLFQDIESKGMLTLYNTTDGGEVIGDPIPLDLHFEGTEIPEGFVSTFTELDYVPGEDLVLMDRNGVKITMLGKRPSQFAQLIYPAEDPKYDTFLGDTLRVENNSGQAISPFYLCILEGGLYSAFSSDPIGNEEVIDDIWITFLRRDHDDPEAEILSASYEFFRFEVYDVNDEKLFFSDPIIVRFDSGEGFVEGTADDLYGSYELELHGVTIPAYWITIGPEGYATYDHGENGEVFTMRKAQDESTGIVYLRLDDGTELACSYFFFDDDGNPVLFLPNSDDSYQYYVRVSDSTVAPEDDAAKEEEVAGTAETDAAASEGPGAEHTDKETVKAAQQALNDAGYNCGTPDGIAGKNTKSAITSYQTDRNLTVTGTVTDELLAALGLN